eukprot:TRINITY_DN60846_c0_g1_i2.p1 TRINITY_DN60846_c0_g1~~TRINITY_DN60846_c0_g1_i2.p1  ORF type:complete len:249 (-),score=36.68 TRINITY_DN60846_c0_g1_i2:750-1496(-)
MSSLVIGLVQRVIWLAYLFEHHTGWLVLGPRTVDFMTEVWKILKATRMKLQEKYAVSSPEVEEQKKEGETEEEEDDTEFEGRKLTPGGQEWVKKQIRVSAEADGQATKWMLWFCTPLIVCYALYSLWYFDHSSWISFLLNTGVIYSTSFSFMNMIPQVLINYKLKSVEHMSWGALCYKALASFSNDLYPFFVTDLPMIYRISCFSDDVIFLIYVYQRWLYPAQDRVPAFEVEVGKGSDGDADGKIKQE